MHDQGENEVFRHSRLNSYGGIFILLPIFFIFYCWITFILASEDASAVRVAQGILIVGVILATIYFSILALERTVISGDLVELRVAGFIWKQFSIVDITGYRRCKQYYTRKYHLPLWLYQNGKCIGDIGGFPGIDRVSELLRERRCVPQFSGKAAYGSFRLGVFLMVEDGCLCRGRLRVPLSKVSIRNGVLYAPNGKRLGWVTYMTTNADLLAWLLIHEQKDLTGTMLGKALL